MAYQLLCFDFLLVTAHFLAVPLTFHDDWPYRPPCLRVEGVEASVKFTWAEGPGAMNSS